MYIGTGNGAALAGGSSLAGRRRQLVHLVHRRARREDGQVHKWHYQETPEDSFDFDSTQQIVTADLTINGEKKHVVMHAPKNGVFYVLEAYTGKLISGKPYVPTVELDERPRREGPARS